LSAPFPVVGIARPAKKRTTILDPTETDSIQEKAPITILLADGCPLLWQGLRIALTVSRASTLLRGGERRRKAAADRVLVSRCRNSRYRHAES
jgi:hypothetical protein